MHPDDHRVVSNFTGQVLRGEPITLYGDSNQTVSFCSLKGFRHLMNTEGLTLHEPTNTDNSYDMLLADLADHVLDLSDSTPCVSTSSCSPTIP